MNLKTIILQFALLAALSAGGQQPGEIVFSKQPVDPVNPGTSVTMFTGGDAIYAMAYFPKTIMEMARAEPTSKVQVEVFIYTIKPPLYSYQQPLEEQLVFSNVWISGPMLQKNYMPIELAPLIDAVSAYSTEGIRHDKFGKKYDGPMTYSQALGTLPAGDNKLKILVKCHYRDVATGLITLSGTDFSCYTKLAEDLAVTAGSIGAQNVRMPKSAKEDEALRQRMIVALKNSQTFRDRMAGEVLRLVIVDPDWMIRRNEITGAILHRYIRAAVAIKDASGNCALFDLVTFQEDYYSGKFQPLKFDGAGDKIPMDCANVFK